MRRTAALILLLAGLVLTGCFEKSPGSLQQELGMTVLNSVSIYDRRVEVHVNGDFSSSYTVQKTSDPYTAIVELIGVAVGDLAGSIPSEKVGISEVRLAMVQTPVLLTRIEIVFSEPLELLASKQGSLLVLDAVEGGAAVQEEISRPLPIASTTTSEGLEAIVLLPATEMTAVGIDSTDGETMLSIYGDGSMEPDIFTLPGRIVIDIPGVTMKAPMPSTLSRPVRDIRFGTYDNKVRFVLDMEHDGDFLAVTEDNTIVVSIPVEKKRAIAFGKGITPDEPRRLLGRPV